MLTDEQLATRRTGITGTDSAAIMGKSPWKGRQSVWLDKLHPELAKKVDNNAVYWGSKLEATVIDEYARLFDVKVEKPKESMFHPEFDWILGSVDGICRPIDKKTATSEYLLEAKTTGQFHKDNWGPSGSNLVPIHYLYQCMHYMIVTGYQRCDVAVLIGGQDFRYYHIYEDAELQQMMIDQYKDFWFNYVVARKMPPEEANDRAMDDYIERKYARARERIICIDKGHEKLKKACSALLEARKVFSTAEETRKQAEKTLKEMMADAAELHWDSEDIHITWRNNRDSIKIDWEEVAREVIVRVPEAEREPIVTKHTSSKQGPRVFKFKEPKEDK
jgi:putative phage-type endonuclease